MTRVGSLCSGYGGLEMGALAVIGGDVAWHAEVDPDASKVLTHHWPDVPNLGDLTAVDWGSVEPVDVLMGGFPCQDLSYAGRGAGIIEGNRSGLWYAIADALGVLRPRVFIAENVAAIVGRRPGLDVVLASLASLGFDAGWTCVRASDVGAPHRRDRWFCVAADARRLRGDAGGGAAPGQAEGSGPLAVPGVRSGIRPPADTEGQGRQGPRPQPERGGPERSGSPTADAQGDGRDEGWPEPAGILRGPDAALSRSGSIAHSSGNTGWLGDGDRGPSADTDRAGRCGGTELDSGPSTRLNREHRGHPDRRHDGPRWGPYEGAILRWARTLGRPAPAPTEPGRNGQPRLSAAFVEWMMGLPAGHVTGVPGLARNAQLRILGNGVVPAQATLAIRLLLDHARAVA